MLGPSVVLLVGLLLALPAPSTQAIADTFVVNCAPLTVQRSDPIVNPGVASGHVHAITGGNAFRRSMPGIFDATNANATTCDKKLDHSNYWVPQLYHYRADGRFEIVPWVGTAIYYQVRACNYSATAQYCDTQVVPLAFPHGFRMLAGDTTRRSQNNNDITHRAVQMMCMTDEYSVQFQGLPPMHCDKIRAEVYFPSCWDGVNLDSPNHKSHVAYPAIGDFDGGVCPQSHPVALLSIFYEFFFDTSSYTDVDKFVFSNGDNTGFGFHGDFIMGWTDRQALQTAHQTCLGPTDAECPINTAGAAPGQNQQGPQTLIYPAIYEEDIGLTGPIAALPGNNPVNFTSNRFPRIKISIDGSFVVAFDIVNPLKANGTLAAATIFDIMATTGSSTIVNIRNEINGQYVSAENAGSSPLVANRGGPQGWEAFVFTPVQNGTFYTITANANSQFVALQADKTLLANGGSAVNAATKFVLTYL